MCIHATRHTTLGGRSYYHPHFSDEETEAREITEYVQTQGEQVQLRLGFARGQSPVDSWSW